jgi:hypothetical protein
VIGSALTPVRVAARWVGYVFLALGVLMTSGRVRLLVAVVLFAGWIGWLAYTTLEKDRGPVVSRAQAAAAPYPVWAEVKAGTDGLPEGRVKVESLIADKGPAAGTEAEVTNLIGSDGKAVAGFVGAGKYLLLLTPDRTDGRYRVADELQRSPGYDVSGRPTIYPWSREVEAQAKALYR